MPDKPLPQPEPLAKPYWDSLKAGALQLQKCGACGRFVFYPRVHCTHCGSPLDGSAEVRGITEGPAPRPAPAKPRGRRKIWPFIVLILALVAVAIWWRCIRTQSATVAVTGHRWERIVARYESIFEEVLAAPLPSPA